MHFALDLQHILPFSKHVWNISWVISCISTIYVFICLFFGIFKWLSFLLCRLTSGKFEEPKTPSPRHTNPRKKQKRDVHATRNEDSRSFRYTSGLECLRWHNRKPFRRAVRKRVELQSLSLPPFYAHNNNCAQ